MRLSVGISVVFLSIGLASGAEVRASNPALVGDQQSAAWSAELVRQLFQSGRVRPADRLDRYKWDTICAAAHHVSSDGLDAGGDRLLSAWLASTRDAGVEWVTQMRDRDQISEIFNNDQNLARALPPKRVKKRCVAALG